MYVCMHACMNVCVCVCVCDYIYEYQNLQVHASKSDWLGKQILVSLSYIFLGLLLSNFLSRF